MKNSNDTIVNRTRDLPSCSASNSYATVCQFTSVTTIISFPLLLRLEYLPLSLHLSTGDSVSLTSAIRASAGLNLPNCTKLKLKIID